MNTAGSAHVAVELAGERARPVELTSSSYLQPRLLGVDGHRVRVALVGICAMLLAGDDCQLDVAVGPGVRLELVEPTGIVAYNARGGTARWAASARIAADGRLVWAGAPFVVADGADVNRHTDITLAAGAGALLRETLVLGRSGEVGGRLRATLGATHDGRPLLVEDLDLQDPALRSAPGILGGGRVLGTITMLGVTPGGPGEPHETTLAGPGAQRREITDHAHLADEALASTWTRWRDLVACPDTAPHPAHRHELAHRGEGGHVAGP